MTKSTDEILYEVDGDVGIVTFNRPKAMNALTFGMYERLAEICGKAEGEGLKALIICGGGGKALPPVPTFRCSETLVARMTDAPMKRRWKGSWDRSKTARSRLSPPLQVSAPAGAPLLRAFATCDFATKDLRFVFPIARTLGNCLSIGNLVRLSGLLGPGRARK